MIPRSKRLARRTFPLAASGRRFSSEHFSLSARSVAEGGGCAAIVSKKTARRAVDRHRLKRRILDCAAPWCAPTRTIVVYARAGSPDLPFAALKKELAILLHRAFG